MFGVARGYLARHSREAPLRLQKLHAIHHLLGDKNLSNQHRASDEEPNGRIRRREQEAWARRSESRPVRRSGSRPPEGGSFYVLLT